MVRILELPDGKPLQSELIKKLTGSEEIPVRTLFKGFIDFQPQAKPHMSGNGLPKITDTSNGIWRRMLFVKWPVTLAEHEQRDFEIVVGELVEESAGILNWLIDGALDYLQGGLFIADSIRSDTREYREESDIVMQFFRDCVEPMPGHSVRAREMYLAFKDWCTENSKSIVFETRFGRDMKRHCKRDDGRVRSYLEVRLRDDRPRPQPANKAAPASGMDDYVP
jgi:putative DNA primase/helicase